MIGVVDEILCGGMTPAFIAVVCLMGIPLKEDMGGSLVVNEPVGVIEKPLWGKHMEVHGSTFIVSFVHVSLLLYIH
jgi:hypothetical protein